MKRKKWKEEEEETLIREYSELLSAGSLAKLRTREKKFQPIADRVNALHHHRDPFAFPFRWSWRDVSIKIQNMRHQYLNVKHKLLQLPPSSSSAGGFDWEQGVHLWPNFLLYKEVFGDLDLDPPKNSADLHLDSDDDDDDDEEELEEPELAVEDEEREDEEQINDAGEHQDFRGFEDAGAKPEEEEEEEEEVGVGLGLEQLRCRGGGRLGIIGSRVVGLGKMAMRREERRREREAERETEDWERWWRRRAREQRRKADVAAEKEEEERRERWRRRSREERREEEEMEWRERLLGMQIEYEKQVMQMHADACQAQMQMIGILFRLVCQFLGAGASGSDGGLGGMPHPVMQQQQQQQQSPESLVGDNGKNGDHSGGHYL